MSKAISRLPTLAQPPTPMIELSLDDLELCGEASGVTRAIDVPSELLAQLRGALATEADVDDSTIAMPAPTFPPPQESRSGPPPRPRRAHIFLAVLLGLVVSGGEVLVAASIHRAMTSINRPS